VTRKWKKGKQSRLGIEMENILEAKTKFFRFRISRNYVLSNFHPRKISWPSYRVRRKGEQCRLDIYIRNSSDILKWRWFSRFLRNYVFSNFGMFFSNAIWWRHQYDSSTFTSKSWTSAPIVINSGERILIIFIW